MQSYKDQLAKAKAEKAARLAGGQGGQQAFYSSPPSPPPAQYYQPPPPPPQASYQQPPPQAYQQQQQAPPQAAASAYVSSSSALPYEANEAVATLLTLLSERVGSGIPLSPSQLQAFTSATQTIVAEARHPRHSASNTASRQGLPDQTFSVYDTVPKRPPPPPPAQQQQQQR